MAQEKGIRLTALAPYFKGSMAQISTAVTAKGGLIHALNSFRGEDEGTWGCVLKVAEISQDDLLDAVRPLVVKIWTSRKFWADLWNAIVTKENYQPFGSDPKPGETTDEASEPRPQ